MPFPVTVQTTTVVGKYLDAIGRPAKGTGTFKPDLASLGEGVAVTPVPVRVVLDADGAFSVELPASVNTGLDPDFTYEFSLALSGGTYSKRIYQIPVSDDEIDIETLVPVTTLPSRARFVFPSWTTAPLSPRPGETYYDPETGDSFYWNAVLEEWIEMAPAFVAPGGPAGGSLAGTYPNPTLAVNSVDTAQLKDASVTSAKLSVQYVPVLTYNNDLATTAQALGDLEDLIDTKAALVHTHTIANVTGLQTALDGKASAVHLHEISDVNDLQVQLDGKQAAGNYLVAADITNLVSYETLGEELSEKADLVGGVIPTAQIPVVAVTEVFTAANQAAMLALTAQRGDMAVRTDNGHRYVLSNDTPGTLANWVDLGAATDAVTSVNGQTGIVVLGQADVGLSNVNNTSDASKPISTATQAALDDKMPKLGAEVVDSTFTVRKSDNSAALRMRSTGSGVDYEKGSGDIIVSSWSGALPGQGSQTNLQRWRSDGTTFVGTTFFGSTAYAGEQVINAVSGVAALGNKNGLINFRIAGARTSSGAPTTGTWTENDVVLDKDGYLWRCTASGTPGTWDNATASAEVLLPASNGTDDTTTINTILAASAGKKVRGRPGQTYQMTAPPVVYTGTYFEMYGCTVNLKSNSNSNLLINRAVQTTRRVTDAAMSTGTPNTLTSATAAFVAGDVGKTVLVHGAGANGALLKTTISGVTNSTTATLTAPASTTVSNTYAAIGNRDANITVRGGTWIRQATNNGGANGWDKHSLRFRHVDGLTVEDVTVQTLEGKYAISIGDVTDVKIRDISFAAFSDGVHIQGPTSKVQVQNVSGTTGDDTVAITPRDWTSYDDVFGDVTDVIVENIRTVSTAACVFKVLGGSTATAARRINASKLYGTGNNNAVFIGDDTAQVNTTGGLLDEINVQDASCTTPNNQSFAYINGQNIRRLQISGVKTDNASATAPIIRVVSPGGLGNVATLTIADIDVQAMNANQIVKVDAAATVSRLVVDGMTVASSASGASGIMVGGSVPDLTVSRVTGTLSGSSYLVTLENVTAAASCARLSLSEIHLTGTGGGLISAVTSGHTLPRVEMSNVLLNGTAWLADLNTTTELHLSGVTTISPTAGMLNVRAAAALTIRGEGFNLPPGGQNINIASGGTVTSKTFALECDLADLQLVSGSRATNTNASHAAGLGPAVCDGTAWRNINQASLIPGRWRTGSRYAPVFTTFAPATVNLNEIRHVPIDIPSACTLTEIACEVTTGAVGGFVRLNIAKADANGRPAGAFVYSSAQLSTAATGKVSATISVAVTPGRYFLSALPQGVLATFRSIAQVVAMYEQVSMATYNRCCYSEYGVTGAPVTVGAVAIDAGDAPRVELLVG